MGRLISAGLLLLILMAGCRGRPDSSKAGSPDDVDESPPRAASSDQADAISGVLPTPIGSSGDHAEARRCRAAAMQMLDEIAGPTRNVRPVDREDAVYLVQPDGLTMYFPDDKYLVFQRVSDELAFANLFVADADVAAANIRMAPGEIVVTITPSLRFVLERPSGSREFVTVEGWNTVSPLDAAAIERFALDAYGELESWRSGRLND